MPTLHAAVLCDSAHKEFGTGKWILVGTWTIVHALAVPVLHPSCALYLCISDANGDYDMELQLVHLGEEERVLARLPGKFSCRDRLEMTDAGITIRGLRFEAFGKYEFRVLLDGTLVGGKPFWVKQTQPPPAREGKEE